jgi:large subunit ribosomal protein L15
MMIHDITAKVGAGRKRKRVGRGEGSGIGGTSGRGHKGAASRSGWSRRPSYEGGSVPLVRRIPKRGFKNALFRSTFHIVNVKALEAACADGAEVSVESLAGAGIVRDTSLPLKVLGEGELTKKLTVTAAKFSVSARSKIEKAGGSVIEVRPRVWTRPKKAKAKATASAS